MNNQTPLTLMIACLAGLLSPLSALADTEQAEQEVQQGLEEVRQKAAEVQAVADAAAEEPAEQVVDDPPEADVKTDAELQAEAEKKAEEEKKKTQEELRKKMQELENELAQKRNEYQKKAREERDKKQKNARANIKNIALPEKPTRAQCEKFVEELRKAAQNINSYSSSDPIVGKLKEIPAEHFDLLIAEIHNRTKLRYFSNYAMRDVDTEVLRERFVQSVDKSEHGIAVIVMHGWVEDVRDSVIKRVESADGSLSPSWFQAAVELQEPKLYGKLHEVTINSRYASQFLNMLKTLPDYDLSHTVNVCWKRSRENKLSISTSTISSLATEHGNAEALGYLVGQLRYSSSYMSSSSSYNSRRINVLRYIDYRGSNKEIMAWYDKNKDKLIFDHYRKRFVLPDTDEFEAPVDPAASNDDAAEQEDVAVEEPPVLVEDVVELELLIQQRGR